MTALLPCVLAGVLPAQARQVASTDSAASPPHTTPTAPLLARPVSVSLVEASIELALQAVAARAGLRLSYSSDIIPAERRVTLLRSGVAAGAVIADILRGTGLDVVVSPSGYVVLVRAPGRGIGDGDAGPAARPLPRAQLMDRLLVMGTPAALAPERALATAVTVLGPQDVAQSRATSMEQLFRSAIPGVVAWDLGISGPFAQIGSVRGSSSFSANYLKTYVDGVELASPYLLFAIDPYSVERLEVIRGPQGSALYGSDAISGVVQVVTRKGAPAPTATARLDAALTGGVMESRFLGGPSPTQKHAGMLSLGLPRGSGAFGGTFERTGAVVPGGSQGYQGTFGGARALLGPLRLDATMRYADVRFVAPANPLLGKTRLPRDLRPLLESQRIEHETYGVTADYQPRARWRHTLVAGIDRHAGAIAPQLEAATVADALLGATSENVRKGSLRYAMALQLVDRPTLALSATLGAEGSELWRERLGGRAQLAGIGAGLASLYVDEVTNRGAFGQLKLEAANAFYLTAGLRGERNSTIGRRYGTVLAPMVGAAVTHDVGAATVKLRAAYGKGIRPPQPSARRAFRTVAVAQLDNPDLAPEVQAGTEAGVELYLGDRATLSLTGYHQVADGLIQQVLTDRRVGARTIQYQNVGRIDNRGVELEGRLRAGAMRGDLSFALTDSRVRALTPGYTGDLAVGARVPEVPASSGAASLTWTRSRLDATVGATYVGSWVGRDWLGFYAAAATLAPGALAPATRLVPYSAITRPFAGASLRLGRAAEWYLRVDNLTNVQRNERDNAQVTQGRTTTLGLRLAR